MRKQCEIWKPEDIENKDAMALPCVRREGHAGPHIDRDNDTWRNDAMASCTETNGEGQQCYMISNHDQEHRFTSVRIACNTLLDDGPCAGVRGHRGDCTANADDIPSTQEAKEPCGAHRREGNTNWPCTRPPGHARYHQDSDGHRWSFPMLLEEMCGADIDDDSEHSRACRLPTDHVGPHLDQCPSTIGKPGEGEHENYIIVQCDGPPRHEGVHHNEEHKHAWNPEGYPPAEPDSLTGRRTEDIIREVAERVARLESREFDARITRMEGRLTRLEEQPTLTEMATSLGRIMERLNVVEENADRVVKIAENLRVRVPAAGSMRDTFAVTAMNNHLGKLIELLSERLPVPEPVTQPCAVLSPGSSTDRCERAAGHDGRHVRGTWTWPRGDGPQPCPATLTYGGDGPGYRCSLLLGHEGLHMDSDNDTWGITGL